MANLILVLFFVCSNIQPNAPPPLKLGLSSPLNKIPHWQTLNTLLSHFPCSCSMWWSKPSPRLCFHLFLLRINSLLQQLMQHWLKLLNSINGLLNLRNAGIQWEAVDPDLRSFLQEHHQILHFFPSEIQKIEPVVMNPWKRFERLIGTNKEKEKLYLLTLAYSCYPISITIRI